MSTKDEIKRLDILFDKYKESIKADKDFIALTEIALLYSATHPYMMACLVQVFSLTAYAYCIGRERGRKESVMKAMLKGKGNE